MSCYFQTEEHSSLYNKYRFDYPKSLYDRILAFMSNSNISNDGRGKLAIDVGCGTGQNTWPLAELFESVIGVDPSETQLEEAKRKHAHLENVTFKQGKAEDLKFLEDGSVDLVTTAMALHWFDRDKFYQECQRVLRPGGVLAIISFGICGLEDTDNKDLFNEFFKVDLAGYSEVADFHVLDHYRELGNHFLSSIYFSHSERDDTMSHQQDMTIDDVCGLIKTVPAWQKYRKHNPAEPDPLENFSKRLQTSVYSRSSSGIKTTVKFPLHLLLGMKTSMTQQQRIPK